MNVVILLTWPVSGEDPIESVLELTTNLQLEGPNLLTPYATLPPADLR